MPIISIKAFKCNRCGYIWSSPRHDTKRHLPHACAKCKSSYWNTPRVLPPKKAKEEAPIISKTHKAKGPK